jgi:hypothetical protein
MDMHHFASTYSSKISRKCSFRYRKSLHKISVYSKLATRQGLRKNSRFYRDIFQSSLSNLNKPSIWISFFTVSSRYKNRRKHWGRLIQTLTLIINMEWFGWNHQIFLIKLQWIPLQWWGMLWEWSMVGLELNWIGLNIWRAYNIGRSTLR